jgi:hypothetical protein
MENNAKFSIPKPCNEDWNGMTQEEKGRFCSVCSKTVVDFTSSNKEQIQEYLNQNKGKRVCGRFRDDQLTSQPVFTVPESVIYQKRSFHKAFLLALFVVMGTTLFSCKNYNDQTVGEIAVENDSITQMDTTGNDDVLVGKVAMDSTNEGKVPPPPVKGKVKFIKPVPTEEVSISEIVTVGIVAPEPPPSVEQIEPSGPKR